MRAEHHEVRDEAAMRALGARFASRLRAGDVALLFGPLGVGKTTFVRGMLQALGWPGPVRSPTFNLVQVFETQPPLMHADLFRVPSAEGLGIEDYLSSHVCVIEWAEKAGGLIEPRRCWRVRISFADGTRRVKIGSPEPQAVA